MRLLEAIVTKHVTGVLFLVQSSLEHVKNLSLHAPRASRSPHPPSVKVRRPNGSMLSHVSI